jgi:hypothetical protein
LTEIGHDLASTLVEYLTRHPKNQGLQPILVVLPVSLMLGLRGSKPGTSIGERFFYSLINIISVSQTHYLRPYIDLYCNIVSDGASLVTVGNTVLLGAMVTSLFLILKETFSQITIYSK